NYWSAPNDPTLNPLLRPPQSKALALGMERESCNDSCRHIGRCHHRASCWTGAVWLVEWILRRFMQITVKWNDKYREIILKEDNTTIETGLLDKEESLELAR